MVAPMGAVITTVPDGVVQVGCKVTLATGVAGGGGILFTVICVAAETHPVAVLSTVMLWFPGATPVMVAAAW